MGIRYRADAAADHRSAIHVVDEIHFAQRRFEVVPAEVRPSPALERISGHVLSDVFPPGTWDSSWTLKFESEAEGKPTGEAIIGEGWSNDELPYRVSTAMHDILVGLICFETVFVPLSALRKVHTLIGSESLWSLVRSGALRLVNWTSDPSVIFRGGDLRGDLASQKFAGPDKKFRSTLEVIRRHIAPADGKEPEADKLFELLAAKTLVSEDDGPIPIADAVRGLLVRPSIRAVLGLSDALPAAVVPRWAAFPVLRLARLVQLAQTCQRNRIASIRVEYGMPELVGPAFASMDSTHWSEDAARFVLSGRLDADLGVYSHANNEIFESVLRFRETEAAIRLRREVLERIDSTTGADLAAAVDGGLRRVIPNQVLQAAHDKMSGLLTRVAPTAADAKPAIWHDMRYSRDGLRRWKQRSLGMLEAILRDRGLTREAPCPCGSGVVVKDCCRAALRVR